VSLASIFARRVSGSDMLSGIRKMMLKVLSFLEQTAARLVRRPNVDGFTVLSLTASSRTIFLARSGTESMRRCLSSTRINLAEVNAISEVLADSSFSDGKKARAELMSRKGLRTAIAALTTSFSWLRLLPLARSLQPQQIEEHAIPDSLCIPACIFCCTNINHRPKVWI
jgi:hypothetical protein